MSPKRGRSRKPEPGPVAPKKKRPPAGAIALPWDRLVVVALATFGAAIALLVLWVHATPLYGVETDLFGEALPAARGLLAGRIDAELFAYKGPGYPLLLALGTLVSGGDAWFGARLVNVLAAVLGAWAAWRMLRRALGPERAAFATLALCVNPLYVRAAFEAGTDAPTCALALASTALVLESPGVRGAALAGALAGFAALCRYNALFLVPAALFAMFLRPSPIAQRVRPALAFLAGTLAILLPWFVVNSRLHGAALSNRNYANLAFELYGRGMSWDPFWENVAPRFHSFSDVLRYDPAGAAIHLGKNLAARWTRDLRELLPVWIAALALAGALLHLGMARRHAAWLGFYALCYATLCLVFYAPRFFLYLVPFYLGAAALLVFPGVRWAQRWPWLRLAIGGVALVTSAWVTGREVAGLIQEQPEEVRIAGRFLKARAHPGDRILARKPQVAYFAGMDYGPLPNAERLESLVAEARRAGARYVFLSGIEYALRPQLRLMMQPDLHLPGLDPLLRIQLSDSRYGTVFGVAPPGPADAAFGDSLVAALDRFLPMVQGNPLQLSYLGSLYFYEDRYAQSLACFDHALALEPRDLGSVAYRAVVLAELGRLDESARDCETVLAQSPKFSATHALLLGSIRAHEGQLEAGRRAIESAAKAEPAVPAVQACVGAIRLASGDAAGAKDAFDRAVKLAPRYAVVRDAAIAHAGNRAWLVQLVERAQRISNDDSLPAEALADSVAAGVLDRAH